MIESMHEAKNDMPEPIRASIRHMFNKAGKGTQEEERKAAFLHLKEFYPDAYKATLGKHHEYLMAETDQRTQIIVEQEIPKTQKRKKTNKPDGEREVSRKAEALPGGNDKFLEENIEAAVEGVPKEMCFLVKGFPVFIMHELLQQYGETNYTNTFAENSKTISLSIYDSNVMDMLEEHLKKRRAKSQPTNSDDPDLWKYILEWTLEEEANLEREGVLPLEGSAEDDEEVRLDEDQIGTITDILAGNMKPKNPPIAKPTKTTGDIMVASLKKDSRAAAFQQIKDYYSGQGIENPNWLWGTRCRFMMDAWNVLGPPNHDVTPAHLRAANLTSADSQWLGSSGRHAIVHLGDLVKTCMTKLMLPTPPPSPSPPDAKDKTTKEDAPSPSQTTKEDAPSPSPSPDTVGGDDSKEDM
ncbi:hypothetical protein G9A89_002948, partial [Geosiphon pyriformis]